MTLGPSQPFSMTASPHNAAAPIPTVTPFARVRERQSWTRARHADRVDKGDRATMSLPSFPRASATEFAGCYVGCIRCNRPPRRRAGCGPTSSGAAPCSATEGIRSPNGRKTTGIRCLGKVF